MKLDLRQVVLTLSDALDFVGVDDVRHGKRVAWMAVEIGREMGLPAVDLDDLLVAGLLHDCGVSSTREHRAITDTFDWEGSYRHSQRGSLLLESFEPLSHIAPVVFHHHHKWADLEPEHRHHMLANLIFAADRVDALLDLRSDRDPLVFGDDVVDTIVNASGRCFSPDICRALASASRRESFWLSLLPESLPGFLDQSTQRVHLHELSADDLRDLASMFSQIVDAKSPFTASHSTGVARLARALAIDAGFDAQTADLLEIAGLFHDLGKLRVPDRILEKPSTLDRAERAAMARHSFYTFHILHRIEGLEQIARWAAFHHESLTGDGYPFHMAAPDLDTESRIVAVADVLQALAQDRPYRRSLPPERCRHILSRMADIGRLDGDLVSMVTADIEGYWDIAVA